MIIYDSILCNFNIILKCNYSPFWLKSLNLSPHQASSGQTTYHLAYRYHLKAVVWVYMPSLLFGVGSHVFAAYLLVFADLGHTTKIFTIFLLLLFCYTSSKSITFCLER